MAIAQTQNTSTETVVYEPVNVKSTPEGRNLTLADRVEAFIEYPGSRKGNPGWWRVTEWLEAKTEELIDHGSGRRR